MKDSGIVKIDLISESKDGSEVSLYIFDSFDWNNFSVSLENLKRKINGYASVIVGNNVPEVDFSNKRVVIVYECFQIAEDLVPFFTDVKGKLESMNIVFSVSVRDKNRGFH